MPIPALSEERRKELIKFIHKIIEEGNIEICEINDTQDPSFPRIKQPEPIEENLDNLKNKVLDSNADIGFAFDADSDRVGIIDNESSYIESPYAFCIIADHVLDIKNRRNVSTTVSMTSMIDEIVKKYDVECFRTKVGFKYVAPNMEKNNSILFSISNSDPIPNFDNESCETLIVFGCTNLNANNFNANVNVDNGSCIISGCIDPFAQNTDSLANYDDGSCVYEIFLDTLDNNSSEDCILPETYTGNTGVNMTVFFTSPALSLLPLTSSYPYIVAINNSGQIVGSASLAEEDLIAGQQSLAVWGDDSSTPETDGALSGGEISFQLIDGNSLYDLSLSSSVTYISNSTVPLTSISSSLNCSSSEQGTQVTGCMHSIACNFDSLATSPFTNT